MIKLLGIPQDKNSSFLMGARKAPTIIRQVLNDGASNFFAENGLNMELHLKDVGDLYVDAEPIDRSLAQFLHKDDRYIFLGGDHSISFPIVKSLAEKHGKLNILHFDAHPDLYDNFQNNPNSHACPFARIMENDLASRLVQVGIRTLNDHQREQAKRFNVEIVEMKNFTPYLKLSFIGPVYISLDLDALDPAQAPGVSHPEPGGLTVRDIITVIHSIKGNIIGCDIVELNPDEDFNNLTARVAAKFVKEIGSRMITNY